MFLSPSIIERAKIHAQGWSWAAEGRQRILQAAEPWRAMSEEHLWSLVFGPRLSRSWHVWSNGHCPACRQPVPMYEWKIQALEHPWKVACPHCNHLFPTNDFQAFHRSGLDERGWFDPARADRGLLFNAEHPDPADPLHGFGVDDGDGYLEGDHRWRFIGYYLIRGQWKQLICQGVERLTAAYVLSGDPLYARKALILLDRVADVYPDFDFITQGWVYEKHATDLGTQGFVSMWHDACEETRELALMYGWLRGALDNDLELVRFLDGQSRRHHLDHPKATAAEVRRNIEDRLLREALNQPKKIHSNYPRCEIAQITLHLALGGVENRQQADQVLDAVLEKATAVDGVTGEKGLAGYSAFVVQSVGLILAQLERAEPGRLKQLWQRHPNLSKTFRFFIDTWCDRRYYPQIGDTLWFACPQTRYVGVHFHREPGLGPSMFELFWQLYELTGDAAYVQVLHHANDDSVKDLPYHLFTEDPGQFQQAVSAVIAEHGPEPRLDSVDKRQWHLAILRHGHGDRNGCVWLDYDAGGYHSHCDGLNLGLFAKGLDLMPDLGYPPVNYGGWKSPQASWYYMTAAHNTVTIDGQSQYRRWCEPAAGRTTLWLNQPELRAIRVDGLELYAHGTLGHQLEPLHSGCPVVQQYERTLVMIDIDPENFYLLDIFRVVGGSDHARFMHSHFAALTSTGLSLHPAEDYGHGTIMRRFQTDPAPQPGWSVDWRAHDRQGLLPPDAEVHLRYLDLSGSERVEASICEGWVVAGGYSSVDEVWIPRLMVRRRGPAPLASTFVGLIEPCGSRPKVAAAQRVPLTAPDGQTAQSNHVAVEVRLADGRSDLILAADVDNPLNQRPAWNAGSPLIQAGWQTSMASELTILRRDRQGMVRRIEASGLGSD